MSLAARYIVNAVRRVFQPVARYHRIVGALLFIPGSYHVYIAWYAWQGEPGYSFDDISSAWDD